MTGRDRKQGLVNVPVMQQGCCDLCGAPVHRRSEGDPAVRGEDGSVHHHPHPWFVVVTEENRED